MIAIIGVLLALLAPAVAAAREQARATQCRNNLRQIGLANHQFLSSRGHWPAGAEAREYEPSPGHPHPFYRWSALAKLLPYLEQAESYDALNFDVPLYLPSLRVSTENTTAVGRTVGVYLCPSDRGVAVSGLFGPTNYAFSAGSGIDGGTPFETDGLFHVNSLYRPRDVFDGLSKTVAASESLLGDGDTPFFGRANADPRVHYTFANVAPLTQDACEASGIFNFTDRRGFGWANGEYRCALYNHYLTPNSMQLDCVSARLVGDVTVRNAAYGWRAARSRHPGGVNVLFADGSVDFIGETISPDVWQALSTRSSGETNTQY